MFKSFTLLSFALLFFLNISYAQDSYKRNTSVDVSHYIFNLSLNDDTNEIIGETLVTIAIKNKIEHFELDLIGKSGAFGMTVTGVFVDGKKVQYKHVKNKIVIALAANAPSSKTVKVQYRGIPEKGLVINTTKFGQRSFFGDNWPNLARHWLPSIDHPYDKATVEFRVTAPAHYDVIATGKKIEESNLGNGFKVTSYKEDAPVAMKVITIGVTKFASKLLGSVADIPVTAWVYPENRLDGFSDYHVAVKVLDYFINNIGPYSYEKLANVQAKTQWGGLENAGTISYFENSVTGRNEVEALIAHEISHQWFGNSITENNWNHVWLSEGFATYFTILYQESVYGNEKRKQELIADRNEVIAYYKKNPSPVIDTTIKNPMKVLNKNTYEKGGWVLNMLRHKLGDETFWKGIRRYYKNFQNGNAMTADFRKVMEKISNQILKDFFKQWLFTKGHPELKWNWNYKKGKVSIAIKQEQQQLFKFPLEIGVVYGKQVKIEKVMINKKSDVIELKVDGQPDNIILDPEVWLLYEDKN